MLNEDFRQFYMNSGLSEEEEDSSAASNSGGDTDPEDAAPIPGPSRNSQTRRSRSGASVASAASVVAHVIPEVRVVCCSFGCFVMLIS